MRQELSGKRNKFGTSLELAKEVITKEYLYRLKDYEVASIPQNLRDINISEYSRIYKLKRIVSDKNESMFDKLVTVLNAAYSSNATVVTLIDGHKDHTDIYLGVVSKDVEQKEDVIGTQGETLRGTLEGNFPGIEIEPIRGNAKENLLQEIFKEEYVTSVSGIASVRNEQDGEYDKFVQGIEHLADTLQGKEYHVVVIADPIKSQELMTTQMGYEMLYTQLSPFLKTSIGFNEAESITSTQAYTDGVTDSIGLSTALTQNYSKTCGWSEGISYSTSENKDVGRMAGAAIGSGAGLAATILSGGTAAPIIAAAAYAGNQVGAGIWGSSGESTGRTTSESGSVSESAGRTNSRNQSKATQHSQMHGEMNGTTHGQTLQFSNENRTIKNVMEIIDKHIERLHKCEAYGAFNCATYIISSDPETNAIASSGYNALMRGDNSSLQTSYINTWNTTKIGERAIKEYLTRFSHPLFKNPLKEDVLLSPASIVNSYELAVNMGLPKKSINGLPVLEMASFGRNVFQTVLEKEKDEKISLGDIFHMGKEQSERVGLDVDSLAMHTFITGSTGSGKSNTVYQILSELLKKDVHFLVVEPAKGEYKNVFGNREDVAVYGTNPMLTDLLRINPFSFPKEIHIYEHLDRLVEIFNVCWPMYAAMPAVLKEAIERAYIKTGWDLRESQNKYNNRLFPNFVDVLQQIDEVMEESQYSNDNKGDYKGALCTRLRSLTNGINSLVFCSDELASQELFDQNVIVDLSRVGSAETKSLIMGILVMKLQEYRMSSGNGMNAPLAHVTVLEEAHNLLRRTSTEQFSESSNLLGKSVEMLSNAIAEMRSYGEGFIIADQSPGLLDMSVIRNTNTKIIMRLPEYSDRELVGRAAGLTEEQIVELSKLSQGVAAVYQNNWIEPVLCKIKKYEGDISAYSINPEMKPVKRNIKSEIINSIIAKDFRNLVKCNDSEIIEADLPGAVKCRLYDYIKASGREKFDTAAALAYELFSAEEAFALMENSKLDAEQQKKFLIEHIKPSISPLSEKCGRNILYLLTYWHAHRTESVLAKELLNDLLEMEKKEDAIR